MLNGAFEYALGNVSTKLYLTIITVIANKRLSLKCDQRLSHLWIAKNYCPCSDLPGDQSRNAHGLRMGIPKLIAAGKLEDVHKEAAAVQYHALTLAMLAMATDSGVPHDNVKGINLTCKELAGKFDAIDVAADAGKVPETKAVYDQMGDTDLQAEGTQRCARKIKGGRSGSKLSVDRYIRSWAELQSTNG